jgi:predicted Zn-dependent protease
MYLLLGAASLSLEQLQLARRISDADFYTMTEIDARIKQVTQIVQEQRDEAQANRR